MAKFIDARLRAGGGKGLSEGELEEALDAALGLFRLINVRAGFLRARQLFLLRGLSCTQGVVAVSGGRILEGAGPPPGCSGTCRPLLPLPASSFLGEGSAGARPPALHRAPPHPCAPARSTHPPPAPPKLKPFHHPPGQGHV